MTNNDQKLNLEKLGIDPLTEAAVASNPEPEYHVDLLAEDDLKNNWWLNSLISYEHRFQISSQLDENLGF